MLARRYGSTLFNDAWMPIKRNDPRGMELYKRHYSYGLGERLNSTGIPKKERQSFVCPGSSLVMLKAEGEDALFAWIKRSRDMDGQGLDSVCCAIFRNESSAQSSGLILEAERMALLKWPSAPRFFTYVAANKIKSTNPGYCFKQAGWRTCGLTRRGLVILEKVIEA